MQDRKARTVKLEFGLRNGAVVSVHSLSAEEKGEKCTCTCPGCGGKLIAKLGTQKRWHFAHKGAECNIATAQQTALHMLAKEIIDENKELLFPGIMVQRDSFIDDDVDFRVQARIPYSTEYVKPTRVSCDSVSLEKKLSNIVPDIIVTAKGRCCLIEIAVTHFVDEEKERKIKEIGLPLLEIDLSELYKSEFSREDLAKAVLYNLDNRKWIYNPLYDEAKKWAKNKYSELIDSVVKEIELENADEEKKLQRRRNSEKKIKDTFEPNNYQKAILALRNDAGTATHLKKLHIKTDINTLPFFLNIPISGEMVFPCDRRIWQSTLFDKFVFYRNSEKEKFPIVYFKRVQSWIKDYNDQFPVDWALTYKTAVQIDNKQITVSLLYDVAYTYLKYLKYLGFLEQLTYREYYVKKTHSLVPPNKEHADMLLDALKKVDWCNPTVDGEISKLIEPTSNTKLT